MCVCVCVVWTPAGWVPVIKHKLGLLRGKLNSQTEHTRHPKQSPDFCSANTHAFKSKSMSVQTKQSDLNHNDTNAERYQTHTHTHTHMWNPITQTLRDSEQPAGSEVRGTVRGQCSNYTSIALTDVGVCLIKRFQTSWGSEVMSQTNSLSLSRCVSSPACDAVFMCVTGIWWVL